MDYDKIYYNFPIAIYRQVRCDNKGRIEHVEDAINDSIRYALYVEYQKRLPYRSNVNELNEVVFDCFMDEMGFTTESREASLKNWAAAFKKYKNNVVFVGVDRELLFNFRDDLEYKSDFEIIQLLAFIAIRSIIGAGQSNTRYKHIKWCYVLSRMAGHEKTVKDLDKLPKFIAKYNSRRLRDKLIKALCDRWHMQYYGTNLGKGNAPLFSFSPDIDLVSIVEREKARKKGQNGPIGNEMDVH